MLVPCLRIRGFALARHLLAKGIGRVLFQVVCLSLLHELSSQALSEMLKTNQTLEWFDLSNNNMDLVCLEAGARDLRGGRCVAADACCSHSVCLSCIGFAPVVFVFHALDHASYWEISLL